MKKNRQLAKVADSFYIQDIAYPDFALVNLSLGFLGVAVNAL